MSLIPLARRLISRACAYPCQPNCQRMAAPTAARPFQSENHPPQDNGWEAAMQGVSFVLHIASPFSSKLKEAELVGPAVAGTKRVLEAAKKAGKPPAPGAGSGAPPRPAAHNPRPTLRRARCRRQARGGDQQRLRRLCARHGGGRPQERHRAGRGRRGSAALPGFADAPLWNPRACAVQCGATRRRRRPTRRARSWRRRRHGSCTPAGRSRSRSSLPCCRASSWGRSRSK